MSTPDASSAPNKKEFSLNTLFIHSVPSSVAEGDDLQAYFSSFGPIKSFFLLPERERDAHASKKQHAKRAGFVKYVDLEDAKNALESVTKDKKGFKAEYAKRRHRAGENDASETPSKADTAFKPVHVPSGEKEKVDVDAIKMQKLARRSLVLYFKPAEETAEEVTKKQVYKRVRKYGEKVTVSPLSADSAALEVQPEPASEVPKIYSPSSAKSLAFVITFPTPHPLSRAVSHLHKHKFHSFQMHAFPLDNFAPAKLKSKARLIIRNLGFDTTLGEVWERVIEFGCCLDLVAPPSRNVQEGEDTKEHAGYVFVTMGSQAQAKAVVAKLNGQKIGKRVVAVDFALNKRDYAQQEQEMEQVAADVTMDVDEDLASEDEMDVVAEETEDASDAASDLEDDENDDVEITIDEETEDPIEPAKKKRETQNQAKKKEEDLSRTLFIQNIPFETTQDELEEFFSQFGQLEFAKLCMHAPRPSFKNANSKNSEQQSEIPQQERRSKGTAFVKFKRVEDAQSALESAALPVSNLTFGSSSVATSSNLIPEMKSGLNLNGRTLLVLPALTRSSVPEKKSAEASTDLNLDDKSDKRNIYLLREGYIDPSKPVPPNSPFASLPKSYLDVQHSSFTARRQKLSKSLHLFISRTRLSIRNLGKKPDEKFLKDLATKTVDEWRKEMKEMYENGQLGRSERVEYERLRAKEGLEKPIKIKQVKLVRDKNRVVLTKTTDGKDEKEQVKNPSLGYGFLEFESHAHALGFLRSTTHREVVEGRRVLVEFSIENSTILKKRENRRDAFGPGSEDKKEVKPMKDDQQKEQARKGKNNKDGQNKGRAEKKSEVAPKKDKKDVPSKPQPILHAQKPKPEKKRPSSNIVKSEPEPKKKAVKRKNAGETMDDFDQLVDRYKKKLATDSSAKASNEARQKWFS